MLNIKMTKLNSTSILGKLTVNSEERNEDYK